MVKTEREKILEKIRKVKVMADRGATKGEVDAAFGILQSMMDEYGITEEEVERKEVMSNMTEGNYSCTENGAGRSMLFGHEGLATGAIAKFCRVECYIAKNEYDEHGRATKRVPEYVRFFGRESDIIAACYLMDIVGSMTKHEWKEYRKEYKRSNGHFPDTMQRKSFKRGLAFEVRDRLMELVKQRKQAEQSNGPGAAGLIKVHDGSVKAYYESKLEEENISTRKAKKSSFRYDSESFGAGRGAGQKINLTNSGLNRGNGCTLKLNK